MHGIEILFNKVGTGINKKSHFVLSVGQFLQASTEKKTLCELLSRHCPRLYLFPMAKYSTMISHCLGYSLKMHSISDLGAYCHILFLCKKGLTAF